MDSESSQAAPRPPTASHDQLVGGRFRILGKLGSGGMGSVYAARDTQTGLEIALKLMRPELSSDATAVERFWREGAALAAVRHPSVVEVLEVGTLPDGGLFLAMELLRGETLAQRLDREGRLTPLALLPILRGLSKGLDAAHAVGVVHRDIKPSNIYLPDHAPLQRAALTGETVPVKLVDFGVARVRGFSKVTESGLAVGTVRYMAPEQLTGAAVEGRADQYALAVVLFEAISGEHPFERTAGDDLVGAAPVGRATWLSEIRPDVPEDLARVIHCAMARLPRDRFDSVYAFCQAFERSVFQGGIANTIDSHPQRRSPEPTSGAALGHAQTIEAATPQPGLASQMRAKSTPTPQRRKYSTFSPFYLLLPILLGICVVPSVGVGSLWGCTLWVTGRQTDVALNRIDGSISRTRSAPQYGSDVENLRRLHEEGELSFLAAVALHNRLQEATHQDNHIDASELDSIMMIVRDIVARRGDYTFEHYERVQADTLDERSKSAS